MKQDFEQMTSANPFHNFLTSFNAMKGNIMIIQHIFAK